jgi:glyoxylase-like metal-dependent hydrolase (beta-lactamase superfamily II)
MAAVEARGLPGFIPADHVTDTSLLEIYVIDVGQGDGILIRTPNDRWHAIDAGNDHTKQMTKKNAANFIRWKFKEDLGLKKIKLENVILSHSDRDHYGGLIDLFQGKVYHPEREFDIEVENFYHPGMGRFAAAPLRGQAIAGPVPEPPFDVYGINGTDTFIT